MKPFCKVLEFLYNPMPINKAKKLSKKEFFLTSYQGEKAVVAAAKILMDDINPSVVVRTLTGWVFSEPAAASTAGKTPAAPTCVKSMMLSGCIVSQGTCLGRRV